MALTRRTESKGKDLPPIDNLDEREYDARLVMVADLGLQEGMLYKGVQKDDAQQIAIGLEIIGESVTLEDGEKPRVLWAKPFNIFNTLTDKGKELEFYKIFEPDAKGGEMPDWDAQLLKPCSVRVVHSTKDDNVYDNVHSITAIPVKYQADIPPALTEAGVGNADEDDNSVNKALYGLPKYVFDKRLGQTAGEPDPV